MINDVASKKETIPITYNGEVKQTTTITDGTSCLQRIHKPLEETISVDNIDIVLTVISIILRLVSIALNVNLAFEYFHNNKWNYFIWTTCCIVIPMIITSALCIHFYIHDNERSSRKNCIKFLWFVIISPFIFRYYRSLSYAMSSKRAEKRKDTRTQKLYYDYMVKEDSDVALIRIFESSFEAAPQKILQISIYLAGEDKMTWNQFCAICGCLGSLTWCIVVYHKYNRVTQPDKENISIAGIVMQSIWHFFIFVSRILCIATVASVFPLWTLLSCFCHALVMCFITFLIEQPMFCLNSIISQFAFALTIGVVYIFTYITIKDGPTFCRYVSYYTVSCIENLACVILFYCYADPNFKKSIVFIPLCIISYFSFFIGILFMILYYKYFHPNVLARNFSFEINDNQG